MVFSQDLKYEMVSYSSNAQSRGQTPLFDLSIFNQPYFTISYQAFSASFQFFFDLIIGISIATAVVIFMVAAFQQIIGGGSVRGIQQGREGMQNAIVGLMIILSTWLIINTINPDLLRLPIFQELDKIGTKSGGTQTASGDVRLQGSE